MTVVNPKSISGINSITTGSGSDDILTIHNNNGTERLRVDSTGATKIVTGIVTTLTATTGIVTTLTTNTLTANSTAKVGSGVTLSPDGDVFATGVCTATSFSGDGSNLTGISAGVSLANGSDNRVVTATGAAALNGESNLTYDGSTLKINGGLLEVAHTSCHVDFMETSTTNHRLRNGSGNFQIQRISDDKNTTTTQFLVDGGTGSVELYHEGTKKLSTQSGGICFNSDTAAANALDDYEEGTFTPTNNSGSGVSDSWSGHYTKIGNVVHFRINQAGGTYGFSAMQALNANYPYQPAHNGAFVVTNTNPNISGTGLTYATSGKYLYFGFSASGQSGVIISGTYITS